MKLLNRWNTKADRAWQKFAGRGLGYKIGVALKWFTIALGVFFVAVYIYAVLSTGRFNLDAGTFFSILLADIPVGLVLWFAFQRNESKRRKLLDASEIVRAPTLYTHLEIRYCDEYEDGIPPHVRYYVVNKSSRIAYYVSEDIQELVEARFIRKFRKYHDPDELNRYFDANRITRPSGYPQGDDLFRNEPYKDEV
jgi:cbb3-type cytochrome oxidase subunit 3